LKDDGLAIADFNEGLVKAGQAVGVGGTGFANEGEQALFHELEAFEFGVAWSGGLI
jgi:hypothetical protein